MYKHAMEHMWNCLASFKCGDDIRDTPNYRTLLMMRDKMLAEDRLPRDVAHLFLQNTKIEVCQEAVEDEGFGALLDSMVSVMVLLWETLSEDFGSDTALAMLRNWTGDKMHLILPH